MGVVGCGLVLAGVLSGALFGAFLPGIVIAFVGAILTAGGLLQEQNQREYKTSQYSYPPYRY